MTDLDPRPARRLRVSHVIVQPVLVWDDGDELAPGPEAAPAQVPLSQLAGLAERMPAELAQLEAQALGGEQSPG